jgi:hypothetical protein
LEINVEFCNDFTEGDLTIYKEEARDRLLDPLATNWKYQFGA